MANLLQQGLTREQVPKLQKVSANIMKQSVLHGCANCITDKAIEATTDTMTQNAVMNVLNNQRK